MTEDGIRSARHQSGHLRRKRHGREVANQIDTVVHSVEAPRGQTMVNGASPEPGIPELGQRYEPTLPGGECRDRPVGMVVVAIYMSCMHITTRACVGPGRQRLWRGRGGGVASCYAGTGSEAKTLTGVVSRSSRGTTIDSGMAGWLEGRWPRRRSWLQTT
jgi:hypothetical protein